MKVATILAGAFILAAPLAAQAADAANPYGNVDHRVDAGNNTGASQVDRLNQAQLNTNGMPAQSYPAQPYRYVAPSTAYAPSPTLYSPSLGY